MQRITSSESRFCTQKQRKLIEQTNTKSEPLIRNCAAECQNNTVSQIDDASVETELLGLAINHVFFDGILKIIAILLCTA